MEYCNDRSLLDYLKERNQKTGFDFVSKKNSAGVIDRYYNFKVFKEMINGMVEVHNNNILHRDLKPENIFMNKDKKKQSAAKIGDFGLAMVANNQTCRERMLSVPS